MIHLRFGSTHWTIAAPAVTNVPLRGHPFPSGVADIATILGESLDRPVHFAALRRSVTPDDRIAVLVGPEVPRLVPILTALLRYLQEAGVDLANVSLISAAGDPQSFTEELPDDLLDVHAEVHDPALQRHLAYVATTAGSKRIYLNRTAAECDQLIVLGVRGYAQSDYVGAADLIWPTFGDAAAVRAALDGAMRPLLAVPPGDPATEICWLLGLPLFIQVIPGPDDSVAEIVTGTIESVPEGNARLDRLWHRTLPAQVDTVVACVTGTGFAALARAAWTASRLVSSNGRIVLLSEIEFPDDEICVFLRTCEYPAEGIDRLAAILAANEPAEVEEDEDVEPLDEAEEDRRKYDESQEEPEPADEPLAGMSVGQIVALRQWLSAADHCRISLLSKRSDERVEALHASRIESAEQVGTLLKSAKRYTVVADADRTRATLGGPTE